MKTSRIGRVIQILTALQSRQSYGVENLIELLKTSKRTFYRDLSELRKVGVPCKFDKINQRYRIDPKFFFSAPNLDDKEAFGLLMLAHKARNHIHLPFRDSTLNAALKIENDLPDKTKRFCGSAFNKISIKAIPQEKLDLLDKKFTQLLDAILNKQIVTICFYSDAKQEDEVINFCPYHLIYNDYTWNVLGKRESNQKICILKLNHIRELYILNKYFEDDKKFDLSDYIGRAWSMIPEGRLYNVKLRFLPKIAHNVSDIQWHSTQIVAFQNDGSAIMEFRVDGLNEITWWILSYGDQVQVIEPAALREKVVKIAENMVKQNS